MRSPTSVGCTRACRPAVRARPPAIRRTWTMDPAPTGTGRDAPRAPRRGTEPQALARKPGHRPPMPRSRPASPALISPGCLRCRRPTQPSARTSRVRMTMVAITGIDLSRSSEGEARVVEGDLLGVLAAPLAGDVALALVVVVVLPPVHPETTEQGFSGHPSTVRRSARGVHSPLSSLSGAAAATGPRAPARRAR
jgi:hypothetical protein